MKGKIAFLKTTLIGGIVFMVPVILMVIVVGKAFQLIKKPTGPIAQLLPDLSLMGIALVDVIVVLILGVICFIAGMLARTTLASKVMAKAESGFLWQIPGYGFIKGMTDSLRPSMEMSTMQTVLLRLDDCWQMAYEVERLKDGRVTVFVPDAPNPWSGSIMLVTEDRIEPMNASMMAVVGSMRQLGRGVEKLVQKQGES